MYVIHVTGSPSILNLLKNHRIWVAFLVLQTSTSHPQYLALIKAVEASRKFEIRLLSPKVGPCVRPCPQSPAESRGLAADLRERAFAPKCTAASHLLVSPDVALGCSREAA